MVNQSSINLAAARMHQRIESSAMQRANAAFDENDFQRERNERSGQYQLQGFASSNSSLAAFGSLSGTTVGA
jgi:hypothetical protein